MEFFVGPSNIAPKEFHLPHLNLIPGKARSWPELPQGSIPQGRPSLNRALLGSGSQIPHSCMASRKCLIFSSEILNHKAVAIEMVPLCGEHIMVTCLQRCLETPDILHPALVTSDPEATSPQFLPWYAQRSSWHQNS